MGSREDDDYWNERYAHLRECEECGEALEYDEGQGLCDSCDEGDEEE